MKSILLDGYSDELNVLKNQGVNVFDFMQLKLGNGESVAFWEDNWIGDNVLKEVYPRMYALESHKSGTVSKKLADLSLDYSFRRRARAGVEQVQYNALFDPVHTVNLGHVLKDWCRLWKIRGSFLWLQFGR